MHAQQLSGPAPWTSQPAPLPFEARAPLPMIHTPCGHFTSAPAAAHRGDLVFRQSAGIRRHGLGPVGRRERTLSIGKGVVMIVSELRRSAAYEPLVPQGRVGAGRGGTCHGVG